MTSSEIRKRFLSFFEKRGHTIVPSSSLIPDDPSVLLTTAGMQQFKKYYGELDPETTVHPSIGRPIGKNAASCQKSFRTSDIDEVGDERHLTFFEMLGNFSFGGYFKKEAIEYAYHFLTDPEAGGGMGLKIEYITVFEGKNDIGVPKDTESRDIWKSLGVTDIREDGMDDVFWGPTGSSGPCGPTTEIYCRNGAGQDIEVWNIVFNQYFYPGSREELNSGAAGKKLESLKIPGVDTGMGLERLAMVKQGTKTIFETDLFEPILKTLSIGTEQYKLNYATESVKRMIADHLRASTFLIADGVRPSNKGAGYVLRRLLRRVVAAGVNDAKIVEAVAKEYGDAYPELGNVDEIKLVFIDECKKFTSTLGKGLKELAKIERVDARKAFDLYQSYGLPYEVIKDSRSVDTKDLTRQGFDAEFAKHQKVSRAGSEAKFGGHGLYLKTGELTIRDESEIEKVTRLHTATHLLHAGLRAVLGPEVRQDGSDITVERTRLDFRFPRKITPEELKSTEAWVNGAIKKDLSVKWEEMSFAEATAQGALGFFREKYPPRVKVYTVYDAQSGEIYSKELCGGPHVEHTNIIGTFKIVKEESSSAGVRRVRGVIEP
jgi:alanyl-tRNA synthetase